MSFFILDPEKNTVSDNIIPSGTSASTASIVIPTTVVVETITTPNPVQETYLNLSGSDTAYTLQSTDNTVEVSSATYLSLNLPTVISNPNKKYTIMRSFGGNTALTIYPYSGVEKIDGLPTADLLHNGDIIELISDGSTGWRTY